jgi:hypothetical protein
VVKVAADSALQEKFAVIMNGTEEVGEEATKEKLAAFALFNVLYF